jgi:hypothetical protein
VAGKKQTSFDDACMTVCGIDHRSIAFLLGVRWNLPAAVISVFQSPSAEGDRYHQLLLERSIVLYADFVLKARNLFVWDEYSGKNPAPAGTFFIPAQIIDGFITAISADVSELFQALK